MDVDSLKAELEQHLAKISDKDAPDGFRDRFEQVAEWYKADEAEVPKSELERELQQIRDEAEAAAKAGMGDRAPETPPGSERPRPAPEPAPRPVPRPGPTPDPPPDAAPGFLQRYGIAVVVAVIVLAAAYYYFR